MTQTNKTTIVLSKKLKKKLDKTKEHSRETCEETLTRILAFYNKKNEK